MPKKPVIKMEVARVNGETVFDFEVPTYLTNLFKTKAKEIKKSENWPGLSFYYMPDILESEQYKEMLRNYQLFDNFGSKMVDDSQRFNIAFLRTAEGRGKIVLNKELPFAVVAERVRHISAFLKSYYQEYLSDYKISGSVQIEL